MILFKIILYQALFLGFYDLFLKKETFFNANRFYLLGTSLLSLLFPLNAFKFQSIPFQLINTKVGNAVENFTNPIVLPELVLSTSKKIIESSNLIGFYLLGFGVASFVLVWKLYKVFKLIKVNKKQRNKDYTLVLLSDTTKAFSFLNYVFIGEYNEKKNYLLKHEKIHVKHKHSWDLLWFELLKILFWFNPLLYLYQKRISTLHEYIADTYSVKQKDRQSYYNHLLNDLFQVENMAFINQFYNKSLIKKRIIMLSKSKSSNWKLSKYFLVLPMLFMMLFIGNSFAQNTDEPNQKDLQKYADFVYAHENSRILTEAQYNEYIKFLKKVNPEKKVLSFEAYKKEVENNASYHLYEVSPPMNKVFPTKRSKDGEVPFAIIDKVPVHPNCEGIIDEKEQRKCLSLEIQKFVGKNFNIELAQDLGLTPGKKRIFVMFKIDKDGSITGARARAPHKDLEEEAIRVVKLLPKMKPGEQDGKAVSVKYSLPISFIVVEGKSNKKNR